MIQRAEKADCAAIAQLALCLWPGHSLAELQQEFADLLERNDAAVFLFRENGIPAAFAQCQLRRDYVEGTQYSPIGYLEGIFVAESLRGCGIAGQLLLACENWAREKGCLEFASDCEMDNLASAAFHEKNGFREANRILCFVKELGSDSN